MFQIVMTVCSILHGATCKTAEMTYADEGQSTMPYACMMGAQVEIAKWRDANPNWTIAEWKCVRAGRFAKA